MFIPGESMTFSLANIAAHVVIPIGIGIGLPWSLHWSPEENRNGVIVVNSMLIQRFNHEIIRAET